MRNAELETLWVSHQLRKFIILLFIERMAAAFALQIDVAESLAVVKTKHELTDLFIPFVKLLCDNPTGNFHDISVAA